MFTKNVKFVFFCIILNLHVIYSESDEYEFPKIDYNYISSVDIEPNDQNPNKIALNTVGKEVQDIIETTLARKLELMENNLNNKIKEAIDAFQTMANKNNNEMQDIIEKTFTRKLELIENSLKNKIKEAIVNDIAIPQTNMIQNIANLTNVVQTISQTLIKENRTLLRQTQLENCTASQNNNKGNETNSGQEWREDISDSRLLSVTVPSSVHARSDIWHNGAPDKEDLDLYMINATGCEYKARGWGTFYQFLSNSTARGGTWRQRLAVRGANWVYIRFTWAVDQDYYIYISDMGNSNMEANVYENIQDTIILQRASLALMSKDRYSQFLYIQLQDGVMSIGALGNSTPWLRHSVTVSAGDVVLMEYRTGSGYGVKLLVCE